MTEGSIFDIKRFALHDGPGLRTTVFLKGCPLSCAGCHNPEGQGVAPDLLFRPDRCTLCGDCIPACPNEALSIVDGKLRVHRDRCQLSGDCVEACLPGALELTGRRKSVEDILELLEDDRIYFDESGGGATFSGGEPFAQPEFLRELLEGCQDRELSVVLDTCGHVDPETFRELTPLASHVLFDLKIMDEGRHVDFTGVHNRWVLENLTWLSGNGRGENLPSVTVRIPLIPGVNDDEDNLRAVVRFLTGLDHSPPVDILPYHRLGVDKYDRVGRQYSLEGVAPPPDEVVQAAVRILEEGGLTVTVRGERHGDD
jgi:pyruvate formate lyase activating enzyme